jgi:nitrogen regulatory protein PII
MAQIVCLVVHDPTKADDVGQAWVEAGATGLTLLDSCGWAARAEKRGVPDDLPLFPSVRKLMRGAEEMNRVLFSVVADDFDVDILVAAAERVLGPLTDPDTGILFVVPVGRVVGLQPGHGHGPDASVS